MIENDIPWPRKGDKLFKGDEDWWHNACLNWCSDSWNLYAWGYQRAGDILVEFIKDTRTDQDILVYPIVFLYRQYIELELKEIIAAGNKLIGKYDRLPACHNIDKLWKMCREVIEELELKGPKEDLDAMEEYIRQFSEKDPSSTAFRYPVGKKGEPLLQDLNYIDLINLKEVMSRIISFFNGTISYIIELLANRPYFN